MRSPRLPRRDYRFALLSTLLSSTRSATAHLAKPKLLLVDDDAEIRTQMKWALAGDYEVFTAGDQASALDLFRLTRPLVVLLDLGLPPSPATPEEGLSTLGELLGIDGSAKVVIISGQGEKEVALRAVSLGAHDFFSKPVDLEEVRPLLRRCVHIAALEHEVREAQRRLTHDTFDGMLGTHASMLAAFASIRKVATTDAPVLILGESGTGKEMAAQAIHQRSARRNGPFVAINCSAIPETLIESELFGHERGAFTGAHTQRKGRIESAEGGTLFLDEIGETPLAIQVKLLRFLQSHTLERVGGRDPIEVDVRVVAATNANLEEGMAGGAFREDLYYRLAVVQLVLPALRHRGDDVILLAQAFRQKFADENKKAKLSFAPDALRALINHSWPGNVRELQNRVRRAVIMSTGKRLGAADLELGETKNSLISLKEARETIERDLLQQALRTNTGNITAAAVSIGVSRPTFYELMVKLGIQKTDYMSA